MFLFPVPSSAGASVETVRQGPEPPCSTEAGMFRPVGQGDPGASHSAPVAADGEGLGHAPGEDGAGGWVWEWMVQVRGCGGSVGSVCGGMQIQGTSREWGELPAVIHLLCPSPLPLPADDCHRAAHRITLLPAPQ